MSPSLQESEVNLEHEEDVTQNNHWPYVSELLYLKGQTDPCRGNRTPVRLLGLKMKEVMSYPLNPQHRYVLDLV